MRALDARSDINPRAVVDLPEPDSPTMAVTLPGSSERFISITAGYQTPSTQKSTLNPAISKIGLLIGVPPLASYQGLDPTVTNWVHEQSRKVPSH
ncbi:unannotated protein [freshwater metagenome]|uniref:Unannotated protein n=1 Tax=freshwater metagenome TaxID=449393 RepID=A0A6J6U6M8_9ZZZZ